MVIASWKVFFYVRIEMYSIGMFSLDELVKMLDIMIRKTYVEMNLKATRRPRNG